MKFVASAQLRVDADYYHCDGEKLPSNGKLDAGLIAELKPRSPSEGRLLQGNLAEIMAAYRHADAISVLVDADHFDGSIQLFRQAHGVGKPLLWKDFVIDQKQITSAHHHGASAVLIIERCLSPALREMLVAKAQGLGLQVLLEVCNDADWETAQNSAADFIGVNARDLETLEIDVAGARQLTQEISATHLVFALSGCKDRGDRQLAEQAGAIGVLVGTQLMTAPSPELAVKSLQRPLAKVCGITSELDLKGAEACGADMVGFVVGATTPRSIPIIKAQQLAQKTKLPSVLVTPHEDDWEVREWCRVAKPTYVQIHGFTPTPEWVYSLKAIPTYVLQSKPGESFGDGVVLDTGLGGTGQVHDWQADKTTAMARKGQLSLVAGGLNHENAAAAISASGAWGADASSCLESEPSVKNHELMKKFVEAVHGA